jgi:site-specific DNA recombinase
MTSTNGHGPKKRAILYARVSTEEQVRSGYSLAQQTEALREYAAREGYEVLEEVTDPGQSGASLTRPGMDRVRDLVAGGGVSTVLAQDRDRFAREPAYHYLLKKEFEEHGTQLRSLNDRGDDSPEGQLTDDVLDVMAKFERAKTAERTRRGKLRRAKEGKVIPGASPPFGFKYNAGRDNFVVDDETMQLVRRIFRIVGAEKRTMYAVKRTFEQEGVATPKGARYWNVSFIRNVVADDVYRAHSFDEVAQLVTPEVAARLDPEKLHGIWWYNRERAVVKQVSETGPEGKRYKKRRSFKKKPRNEWIAVPIPDAGIPRKWVDTAREAVRDNYRHPRSGKRYWEVSGGVVHCGCGLRMTTHSLSNPAYHYYVCQQRARNGKDACPNSKFHRAEALEQKVWGFVSGLLSDADRLRAGLDKMIEEERAGLHTDPDQEAEVWVEKLAEANRKRSGFQDMAAEGLITFDELRTKLAELEETRTFAQLELEALEGRRMRLRDLERDKATLLESYAAMVPKALDNLAPEERRHVYQMLRLRAVVASDGNVEVTGALSGTAEVCTNEPTSRCPLCPGR